MECFLARRTNLSADKIEFRWTGRLSSDLNDVSGNYRHGGKIRVLEIDYDWRLSLPRHRRARSFGKNQRLGKHRVERHRLGTHNFSPWRCDKAADRHHMT